MNKTVNGIAFHLLAAFINETFDCRFNTLINATEIKLKDETTFRCVSKREIADIVVRAARKGINTNLLCVTTLLRSTSVQRYDPINAYLDSLPAWDGKDRIYDLAFRVKTDNAHWPMFLHRWVLGMVAAWRGKKIANSLVPLLIGAQGYRKSTFCRNILPPELRYAFAESINLSKMTEAERMLGRFLLINVDEFDQLNDTQQARLKHLVQKPEVSLRRLYSNNIEQYKRYASFVGTSNQLDLLKDPTGSRRYCCVEVMAPIDTDTLIDYDQFYAQALHELNEGHSHWLNSEEEAMVQAANTSFYSVSPLMQLFNQYYGKPSNEDACEWKSPLDILRTINAEADTRFSTGMAAAFGRQLTASGLERRRTPRCVLYRVREIKCENMKKEE